MPKSTLDLELGKRMIFVGKYSKQGDKIIIIVPKEHHGSIQKFKNPLKLIVEEIIE